MPQCQAFNCVNKSGCGKSFFPIPDPLKSYDHRKLCKKWIENLHNKKLNLQTFKAHRQKVVCEDHFTDDCFEGPYTCKVAQSLNFKSKRKGLVFGSVPTIVNVNNHSTTKNRPSIDNIRLKRLKAQLKEELNIQKLAPFTSEYASVKKVEKTALDEGRLEISALKQDQLFEPSARNEAGSDQIYEDMPGLEHYDIHESMELGPMYTAVKLQGFPDADIHKSYSDQDENFSETSCQNSNGEIYKNTCGHPCVYCSKIKDAISEDHNYCAKISSVSVGTQTEDITNENVCSKVLFSTPKKKDAAVALSIPSISIGLDDSELRDLSTLEASFRDDSDSTFTCLSDSESDSDQEETDSENTIVSEKKYIVFESALEQLFLALKCPVSHCKCPIDPDDIKRTHIEGSFLSCEIICTAGHTIMNWKSQPMLGKMLASNLLCSAALLFCGQTYTHIAEFAKFMNLGFMSDTTFYRIQRDQVMPVVLDTWQQIQSELLQSVKDSGRPLRLSGDGRCDSPGYNAKYCTYSVMDLETSAILTYVVVQVTETGSSGRMEAEGFRRCMNFLLDEGFVIEVMATDRHVTIRSIMGKEFKCTNHQFDVWHLAKNIKKKLVAKAKLKGAEDLNCWVKAITNHLWWCSSNCNGDKDWLEESWISIVHHSVNEHSFEGEVVKECHHAPIDQETSLKKKWLKKGSRAHNALREVVLDKRLRKDIMPAAQ